jgi:hypothetical protein
MTSASAGLGAAGDGEVTVGISGHHPYLRLVNDFDLLLI